MGHKLVVECSEGKWVVECPGGHKMGHCVLSVGDSPKRLSPCFATCSIVAISRDLTELHYGRADRYSILRTVMFSCCWSDAAYIHTVLIQYVETLSTHESSQT